MSIRKRTGGYSMFFLIFWNSCHFCMFFVQQVSVQLNQPQPKHHLPPHGWAHPQAHLGISSSPETLERFDRAKRWRKKKAPKAKKRTNSRRKKTLGKTFLGGGFKYFYFHPYLGKISNLTNIFQMGWNHQPGLDWLKVELFPKLGVDCFHGHLLPGNMHHPSLVEL